VFPSYSPVENEPCRCSDDAGFSKLSAVTSSMMIPLGVSTIPSRTAESFQYLLESVAPWAVVPLSSLNLFLR